jgi:prepilin-type N-terminal cleavage/methylation domain-containing protein
VIRLKGSADRSDILGMTILELMIVLTIIGIISAISIPIFLDIKDHT